MQYVPGIYSYVPDLSYKQQLYDPFQTECMSIQMSYTSTYGSTDR